MLAAGASARMGRNKLLLELDGEAVVRRPVRRAFDAGLSPILVVLGHEADSIREALDGLTFLSVDNPRYEFGINSSVRLGIAQVPSTAQAAVVILGDMPFVTTEMIRALVARYRSSTAPLALSDYDGVHAPPTLYDRVLFQELRECDSEAEGCGRRIVKRHKHEAVTVTWPRDALMDLDRPEDYEVVRARSRGPAG